MRDEAARSEPSYVLGTGVSHDGSTVLLRDGRVAVGIEKERLSRRKHDGGNDAAAVQYCLDAEGITIDDVDLVVQAGLFTLPERDDHDGPRAWTGRPGVRVVTISHHLAHAYSAIGTAPFGEFDVIVVDGCGSPRAHCIDDRPDTALTADMHTAEKDSHYRWSNDALLVCAKDYSPPADRWLHDVRLPSTRDSIGGFYAALSGYCLGDMDDVGKLMGLAPYGTSDPVGVPAFVWADDRLIVTDEWQQHLREPRRDAEDFSSRFGYFADVAAWAQRQVTEAVCELVGRRLDGSGRRPLALSGGVALNAVANAALLDRGIVDELYIEPAAGDNGIALGCAFYGWLEVLGGARAPHDGSTCFGRPYAADEVTASITALLESEPERHVHRHFDDPDALATHVAEAIDAGAIVGWFQDGSEFGPRALGRRSLLARAGDAEMRDRINHDVKFREDFRPFAPSVRRRDADTYFCRGGDSPYMILVDQVRPEHHETLAGVMHVDGSARVQTVERAWNPRFHALLDALDHRSGLGVVLNTSFNKRGQPIVETPDDALALYRETAIDLVVIGDHVVTGTTRRDEATTPRLDRAPRSIERVTAPNRVRRFSSRDDLALRLRPADPAVDPSELRDEEWSAVFHALRW